MCVLFLFFWAVPRARKKSNFFPPFADETKKYETLFSLGTTNRERERERMSSSRRLFPEQQRDDEDDEEEEETIVNTNDALVKAAAAATTRVIIILLRSFGIYLFFVVCTQNLSYFIEEKNTMQSDPARASLSLSLSLSLDSWKRS